MQVSAAVIVIGNEILSGRTQDTNIRTIAHGLDSVGVRLCEARVVADDEPEIIAAVDACRSRYDYVFTTGGIGPTHDDITAASVARAFGVAIERHPEAVRRLAAHYPPGALNPARLRMAELPVGASLIDNPVSVAPGFRLGNVFVLAGVPEIMAAMLAGVLPHLRQGPRLLVATVSTDVPEGRLAEPLGELQGRHPWIEIGSYPYFQPGQYGVSLVLRGPDGAALALACDEVQGMIVTLGGTVKLVVGPA